MGITKKLNKVVFIHARYLDQTPLETFLAQLFGPGNAEVKWKRGLYQCKLPRGLQPHEIESLEQQVELEHYEEQ